MARYADAVWKPLAETGTAPKIAPTQVILHSAVGSGSLYDLFQYRSNLESHFWVGFDRVEQYLDTTLRADANLDANARAISVESADNGDPDHYPWTGYQVEAIARLLVWAHRTHGIPLRRCPAWDEPGVGWHTMWGAPSHWTPVAKTCPGAARIQQVPIILDLARRLAVAAALMVIKEDDDMFLANVAGDDPRVYLVYGGAKAFVNDPRILAELRDKCGVRYADGVSAATLSLFPTVDVASLLLRDTQHVADMGALKADVAALKAGVTDLGQAVAGVVDVLATAPWRP